jgi:hypothetical protein
MPAILKSKRSGWNLLLGLQLFFLSGLLKPRRDIFLKLLRK